ncbi:lactose-specific PTS system IIBC component [Ligilactobacillus salitolerans]|uniref:PTS system lactose-specific EIICB component n=1 Tax=Ligilactobacillus salitolerans TaxID=1808352 RepID=A0A401IQK8_9LACO|nr:PTS lactose transporter subunit IIBC [Ligilactobacillus salitolerans]GBG93818.1 lactose-specific PTS system IIBC component [Ligilactobacillus salitolerans]
MNGIIKAIEKHQSTFEKISRNIYLQAIKDGFLAAMPVILFSSIFLLCASLPSVFGAELPAGLNEWLNKIYNFTMGVVGMLVSATTARCLAGSMNRSKMPAGKAISEVSVMIAAISGFLLLAVTQQKDGSFVTANMGTNGILSAFVSAFLTVNVYRFCVIKDITIHMPKEVPGTISQNFRDIFAYSFSVLGCALIDFLSRQFVQVPFAQVIAKLFQPLFNGAESYLGMAFIWFLIPLFWFVGVHGPSVVKPAIEAPLFGNTTLNLAAFKAGNHPTHALTENFGNFVGELGGTGATFVVPFIFMLAMRSKQLRAVGKASFLPVMFAVNEPLLFAAPMILNPYMFVPFLLAPVVNVLIGKAFIQFLGMNGFMYVLPWATPGPIGTFLATGFQPISLVFVVLLLAVDTLIYFPFIRAYDKELCDQEAAKLAAEGADQADVIETVPAEGTPAMATASVNVETPAAQETIANDVTSKDPDDPTKVLVLCAGAGTSELLANALKKGAEEYNVNLTARAGAYGSHYDILPNFDVVVLAPQVKMYYDDIKKDTDKFGIKLIKTQGKQYIDLTRAPKEALEFVMGQLNEKDEANV